MTNARRVAPAQEVVLDFPPLYPEMAATFHLHGRRDIIFSFGSRIYNPYNVYIPPANIVHEAVHGSRQGNSEVQVLDWWRRYLAEPAFRFAEEVAAHRAEYRWLVMHGDRRERRWACKQVAAKLASPLYGGMVTLGKARKILKEALNGG